MNRDAGTLREDEQVTFRAARLLALDRMPYLAAALLEVTPVRSPGLGTFAVDARWRLYLDPVRFVDWTIEEIAGVLLHEVGHLLRDHHDRHTEHPEVPPLVWNIAGDAEINDDLITAGVPLPGQPITPTLLGMPDGWVVERYAAQLLADAAEVPADPGCGSGAGGTAHDAELDDERGGRSGLEVELIRRTVAEAVRDAAGAAGGAQAGAVPAGVRRWAEQE
ncbi:MAG: hypothetical protein JJT89_18305, partial [Nitriliruptoraceae bacterium]|nr:hypothetical protein [Nitriliruptoraceae bacterium]